MGDTYVKLGFAESALPEWEKGRAMAIEEFYETSEAFTIDTETIHRDTLAILLQ